ncbi:hypothetical protein J132_09366 [Termitomyces sp. J132]|nr:hypothetical protein J132_09366 [Termitomyces sp. J132]
MVEPRTPRYIGGAPLDGDDEVEEWELDEELEEQGLYRGTYRRLVLLYSLNPLTFAIAFALLAALPHAFYPISETWPYPSVPYLRHPFPELLTSAALFSLSYLLRDPISSLFSFMFPSSFTKLSTVFATSLQTLLYLTLQQLSLVLLSVTQHAPAKPTTRDAAFRRVWWLALGWACAEAVINISKGYQARALYRDVLVTVRRSEDGPGKSNGTENQDDVYDGQRSQPFGDEEAGEYHPLLSKGAEDKDQAIKLLVEDELDELIAMRAREELEDAYGVPVIRIPVFLTCLQRVNDLLLTLGLTLLLAQAYLRSAVSRDDPLPGSSNFSLMIAAPVAWVGQCYLALLHTPVILPRMGVPTVVYHASLMSLSAFFGGLAAWKGLS